MYSIDVAQGPGKDGVGCTQVILSCLPLNQWRERLRYTTGLHNYKYLAAPHRGPSGIVSAQDVGRYCDLVLCEFL